MIDRFDKAKMLIEATTTLGMTWNGSVSSCGKFVAVTLTHISHAEEVERLFGRKGYEIRNKWVWSDDDDCGRMSFDYRGETPPHGPLGTWCHRHEDNIWRPLWEAMKAHTFHPRYRYQVSE